MRNSNMKRIGLVVNPIAGMGGSVGLKGTDGETYKKALKLGAKPTTPKRIEETLSLVNREDLYFIVAPGKMGVKKTLLGIDAIFNGQLVGSDLNEKGLLELIKKYRKTKFILTPIGGNGFIFGRASKQFTPEVLKLIDKKDIIIVATEEFL